MKASFVERLEKMDSRVVYTLLLIVVAVPLIWPLGMPVPLTADCKAGFAAVDALQPGSTVIFASGTKPVTLPEQGALAKAVLNHVLNKKLKIVFMPSMPESPRFVEEYAGICKQRGYKEGVDFITLPFMAGEESHYAAVGSGLKSLYREQPSSPLWDSIESVKSVALWIDIAGGSQQRWAMAHIGAAHHVPIVAGVNTGQASQLQQYVASKQLAGLMGGLNGAAQYETLAEVPGEALSAMDAQALGHLWVILLVALGNLGYFLSRKTKA